MAGMFMRLRWKLLSFNWKCFNFKRKMSVRVSGLAAPRRGPCEFLP